MAYDFTADSDIQTTLSGELTAQASEFETQVGQLYSEIDGLASSWKGEDYEAFNEGAHGYEKALADLKESIDLFAKHFERLSAGTEELAVSLATIIENALEGGEAGGAGGQGGAGGSGDSVDQDAARDQTKSDGSVNPYGGGRPDRIENPDGSYSYVYRDKDGKIRQKDTWDKDGNLIGQETYDEDGKTKNYSMQVNQDDGSYVVEKYDGDNILSHEERDADDKLIKSVEYGYDADGKNNLITTTNADGTRYEEDIANDETVGIRVYNKDNELQFENKTSEAAAIAAALAAGGSYSLGPNGMYQIDSKDADGTVETVYNKEGYKTRCEHKYSDGSSRIEHYDGNGKIEEVFEYDADGNPTAHYQAGEDGTLVEVVEGQSSDDQDGNSDGNSDGDSDGDSDGNSDSGSEGEDAPGDDSAGDGASQEETATPVTVSSGQEVVLNGEKCYFLARGYDGTKYYTKGTETDAQVFVEDEAGNLVPYKEYNGDLVSRGDFVKDRKVNMDYQWNITYNNGTPYEEIGGTKANFTDGVAHSDYTYVSYDPQYLADNATTLGDFDRGKVSSGSQSLPDFLYVAPGQKIKYDKPWDFGDNVIEGGEKGKYLIYDSSRDAYFVADDNGSYKTSSDGTFQLWISREQLLNERTTITH